MGKDFSAIIFYNDAAFACMDQETTLLIQTQEEHEQSTEQTGLCREIAFSWTIEN